MNAKGYAQWKNMNEDFKQSGLREDEYCRRKGFASKGYREMNLSLYIFLCKWT